MLPNMRQVLPVVPAKHNPHYLIFKSCKSTGTCFIQKIYAPSSSLLQGKHLPFSPSPLRLNIFRLFVILSLTQLYRYTPEIFLFSTATFKYTYRAPLRRIGQEYSAKVAFSIFQSLKRIQPLPVCAGFFICIRNSLDRPCVTMPSWSQAHGAWISFPPPPFSLLPPFFQNFHINHSFFKIFIIIRFFFIWQYQ